jgi:CBS domain containing-hemolysin-like protein
VYRGSIDKIVGIINVYDVLVDTATEDETIARFTRPVMHVPDSMKVDELLKSLKDAKQHMAIVIDEYGGTDGLITLEDILEEIFGEIQDEHDHEESPIYQVGPRAYVVDARTSLEEVSKVIGLPIEDEEVETVGGWVMHVTGRIPAQGEVIMHGPIQITILGGSAHCLIRVRLDIAPDAKRTGPSRE